MPKMIINKQEEVEATGSLSMHKTAEVEPNVIIGHNCRVWRWSHVSGGVVMGDNVMIGEGVHVGTNVKIGNNVRIQNGAQIFEGVELEDDVFIGPEVCFTNVRKPKINEPTNDYIKTLVKKGASIGANSTIICGITIGEKTIVGAGCVVHKSIPDKCTVVGNPARIVKSKITKI